MWYVKVGSLLFLLTAFHAVGQLHGKMKHLPGTWKYDGGSGYEVWFQDGDELKGSGYRTSKLGDTVKVEDLRIARVNKNYVYTLITHQKVGSSQQTIERKFIGNRRKLNFESIEQDLSGSIRYKFGIFNKQRLCIIVKLGENSRATRLKLTRIN